MDISLRSFTPNDIRSVKQWARDIEAGQYQSRIFPRAFNGKDLSGGAGLCAWYIIIADGKDAGTVWLEKETSEDDAVILGIMLGRKEYFGKGIGRQAILLAIKGAQGQMTFRSVVLTVRRDNTRAIASYQHVGFIVSREGIKTADDGNRIPYYFMTLDLQERSDGKGRQQPAKG